MQNLIKLFSVALLFLCAMVGQAQNFENPGSIPTTPIAYDQNGQILTVVTSANIYRSTNGGENWQQKLSAANAPFLRKEFLEAPAGEEGKFQGLASDRNNV